MLNNKTEIIHVGTDRDEDGLLLTFSGSTTGVHFTIAHEDIVPELEELIHTLHHELEIARDIAGVKYPGGKHRKSVPHDTLIEEVMYA